MKSSVPATSQVGPVGCLAVVGVLILAVVIAVGGPLLVLQVIDATGRY